MKMRMKRTTNPKSQIKAEKKLSCMGQKFAVLPDLAGRRGVHHGRDLARKHFARKDVSLERVLAAIVWMGSARHAPDRSCSRCAEYAPFPGKGLCRMDATARCAAEDRDTAKL